MNKHIYLCIDLKTFYASVECVERNLDPYQTDLVVADVSRGKGAICLAISPKMKARGIKNRCRLFEVPKNVHPIIAKPRMRLYIKYSAWIYSIYLKYISKDDIYPYSIDEMFFDITSYLQLYNMDAFSLAKMIIKDVYDITGITASAGIGTNLYLTKIALDILAKKNPNHIGYLNEEIYIKTLWHHQPLSDFWRINKRTEKRLNQLNIYDMDSLAHFNPNHLYREFGINARFLIDHSWGIEPCTIADIKAYQPQSRSLSNHQILFKDYSYQQARIVLTEMVDNLILQLVAKKMYTRILGFSIGYSKDVIPPLQVSFKLEQATDSYHDILKRILDEYDKRINIYFPIRRLGVHFGALTSYQYHQLTLFTPSLFYEDEYALANTILAIKDKYGASSILRAISYQDDATQRERNKLIGGHNAE